jgi:uncharacterized protein YeaO (DUF488 family)
MRKDGISLKNRKCANSASVIMAAIMAIRIVQLGASRKAGEGLRIGTVRRPPRGVAKSDFARLDYYDVWFPNLSPSAGLVKEALAAKDERAWAAFTRKFRREMSAPDRSRELDLLAALSHHTNLGLGCYCLDEKRCHRSVLRQLLSERGANIVG